MPTADTAGSHLPDETLAALDRAAANIALPAPGDGGGGHASPAAAGPTEARTSALPAPPAVGDTVTERHDGDPASPPPKQGYVVSDTWLNLEGELCVTVYAGLRSRTSDGKRTHEVLTHDLAVHDLDPALTVPASTLSDKTRRRLAAELCLAGSDHFAAGNRRAYDCVRWAVTISGGPR